MLVERWKEGLQREDRRAGEVAAMIYNIHRDSKKDPKGMNWLDVFPEWKDEKPAQTEEEMFETMQLWTHVKPLPS